MRGGGGGGVGDMMQPVIKRGRKAVGVGGRCDSRQILLTEHPSYLPHKDVCLRKQTGGRQRRRDAHLNSEIGACAHTNASTRMQRSVRLLLLHQLCLHYVFFFVFFFFGCFCLSLCVCVPCVCESVSNCAAPAQSSDSRHGDTELQI